MNNIIYARVSTTNYQDYQRQISDLNGEIVRAGYSKDSIIEFAEKLSGYTKNQDRPALKEMMEFINDNPNSKVWVTEISRLGRNPNETRKTIDELSEKQIPVYIQSIGRATLDKDGKRDFIVNIILQVLMEFAHSEAEQMKTRIKSGKLEAAKNGKHSTNVFPYGYKKGEDGKMEIQDSEVEVVKMIFDMYSKGKGMRAIATILNTKQIPTKFNLIYDSEKLVGDKKAKDFSWGIATVRDILKNPVYKGQKLHKGETVKSPIIISEELFDRCNDIRETKTTRNFVTTYTYLLKDLMVCGKCGRNYYARYKPNAKGDKVYMCSSKITSKPCGQAGVNIPYIETAIFNELITSPTLWQYLSGTVDMKQEVEDEIISLKLEQEVVIAEKKELKKKLDKILDLLLSDSGSDLSKERFAAKNGELEEKLTNVEHRLSLIKKELAAKERAFKSFDLEKISKEFLEKSMNNRAELQAIFKQFISKLVINSIGEKYFMISMFFKFGDFRLPHQIKLFLDRGSVRFNPRYLMLNSLHSNPQFNEKFILINNDDDELLDEFENETRDREWKKLNKKDFLPVS